MSKVTPLLIELVNCREWSLSSVWKKLKSYIAHRCAFGPITLVGDKRWQEWDTKLMASSSWLPPLLPTPPAYGRATLYDCPIADLSRQNAS